MREQDRLSELRLLERILPEVKKAAAFYNGPHPRARQARQKVDKTSRAGASCSEQFHAEIDNRLGSLIASLSACTRELLLSSTAVRSAVRRTNTRSIQRLQAHPRR